jgi:methylglutaconyl-CoA hydratase
MMSDAYVRTETQGALSIIEFYYPPVNSLPGFILKKLENAIIKEGENPDTHLILLRSGGKRAFCAGASFDELSEIGNLEDGKKFFSGFANVINAMRKSSKIIVGRVHGKTVGGGVGLVCAMDYCFAVEKAAIRLSELAVGIGPFVVGPAVERKIGLAKMTQITLTPATWQSSDWAKDSGMFTEVFPTVSEMDQHIIEFTNTLLSYNPRALHDLKRTLWEGYDHWDALLIQRAEISGKLVLSEFTRSAIAKFKAK